MKERFINYPLFKLQRKNISKLFVIFSVIVSMMLFITIALFPVIQELPNQLAEISPEIADVVKQMMFMGSIEQYFNLEALEMWIFLVSIFVSVVAINITTNEFKNGSYELIYTLNMSRGEIVRTKLIRLILNTIYINVICFVVSLIALLIFGAGSFSVINLIIYTLFAILVTMQIAVIVFSLGLFSKKHFSTFAGIFIVIIMFLFAMISSTGGDKLNWIGYLSPMSTMKESILINGFGGIFTDGILLGIWSIISLVLLFVSFKKFKNDDLC